MHIKRKAGVSSSKRNYKVNRSWDVAILLHLAQVKKRAFEEEREYLYKKSKYQRENNVNALETCSSI